MSSVEEYLLKRIEILMDLERRYPDRTELERLTIHLTETIKLKEPAPQKPIDLSKITGYENGQSKVETAWQLYKLAGGKEDRLVTFMLNNKEYF